MKVNYVFDLDDYENNDKFELKLVNIKNDMYNSLTDIAEYVRQINKDNIVPTPTVEQVIENLREFISDSRINEVF